MALVEAVREASGKYSLRDKETGATGISGISQEDAEMLVATINRAHGRATLRRALAAEAERNAQSAAKAAS